MRELEIKIQFDGTEAQEILDALRSQGHEPCSSALQLDHVYAFDRVDIENPKIGAVVARVRTQGHRNFVTVKVRRSADLDRLEYETEVVDGSAARAILSALRLTEMLQIRKQRWTFRIRDGVTVCVDEVDGLGTFVEVEILEHEVHDRESQLRDEVDWITRSVGRTHKLVELAYDRLLLMQEPSL
jgi:adenylate cyclase class 2